MNFSKKIECLIWLSIVVVIEVVANFNIFSIGEISSNMPKFYWIIILSDRIFVRDKERMVKLFLKDILYLEAERNYCRIHPIEKEYLLSSPLKSIEEKIETSYLMRVHRSYVINLTQINEVAENHLVIRKKAIPVSKSYKEDFLRRIRLL